MPKRSAFVAILLVLILLVSISDAVAAGPGRNQAGCLPGIHVHKVDMKGKPNGAQNTVKARVWIRDEDNRPVGAASVTVWLAKPNTANKWSTKTTAGNGTATWMMESRYSGLWTICVTYVYKSGYVYEPWHNQDLCDVIWYP